MSEPLFVSQDKLEEWVDKGEVTFDDNVLTLLKHGASYLMEPAAKVTSLLDGEDTLGLMDKVWGITDLEAQGAEYFADSVVAGDTAYQCEPGFVGKQMLQAPAAPPPLPPKRAAKPVTGPPAAAPKAAAAPPPASVPAPARAPAPAPAPVPVPAAAAAPAPGPIELTEEVPPPMPPVASPPAAPPTARPAPAASTPAAAPAQPAATAEGEAADMDLLTDFLLDNL